MIKSVATAGIAVATCSSHMASSSIQNWALVLSNQIKAIQTSWADDEPKVRREMLVQELKRALDKHPSHEREERLAALRAYFPVPEGGEVKVVEVVREAPARQTTADEALDLLIKAAGRLSEAQRQAYSEKLQAAGYKITERKAAPVATPETTTLSGALKLPEPLVRKLGLRGEFQAYPTQITNVLLELIDCVQSLSVTSSAVLTEMRRRAGEVPPVKEEDVQSAVAKYLVDQQGGSLERMRVVLAKTRSRLAAFFQVPVELPRDLCERAQSLAPEKVVETVRREKDPGFMANKFALYWEKYERLWKRDQWGEVENSAIWERKVAQSVLHTVERTE